jgi:uncharacterized membrane protein YuzA (DUF378 family)
MKQIDIVAAVLVVVEALNCGVVAIARVDLVAALFATVDNAHVVKTDIAATSGVIHVIDAVILPAER